MRNLLVLALISIACMQLVSGHAYFTTPVPREPYCSNSTTCVNGGALGAQGPVWKWSTGAAYSTDTVTATSCGTAGGVFVGSAANPTGTATTMATWTGGSTATVSFFISETHASENQTEWPGTDGWEIRYRDATDSTSTFTPFTVTTITGLSSNTGVVTPGTGPFPDNFVQGNTVTVTVNVPNQAYTDMEIQFIWSQANLHPAGGTTLSAMWLSCADVAVTHTDGGNASPLASSSIAMFIPALLLALYALF